MKPWQQLSILVIAGAAAAGWIMLGGTQARHTVPAEIGDLNQFGFVPSRAAPEVTLIDTATDKVAAVSKPWRATDQKAGLEEGRDPDDTVAHRAFLYLMGFGGRISRSLRLRDTARQIGQNH